MLYYSPNRPKLIPADPDNPMNPKPDHLNKLESLNRYVAELKWNGDNTLIYTDTKELWNRHNAKLCYTPSDEVRDEIDRLPKGAIFNAELMHRHTKTVKHLLIIHTVMAYKGRPLLGERWGDARKIIEDLDLPLTELGRYTYDKHIVLSRTYTSHFWDLYQSADGEIIEGIILKDPKGFLRFSTTPLADVPWMLKVRKACKKYSF